MQATAPSRTHAIPMAEYRRRVFLAQFGPPALSLILATTIFTVGTAVWEYLVLPSRLPQSFIQDTPLGMIVRTVPKPAFEKTASAKEPWLRPFRSTRRSSGRAVPISAVAVAPRSRTCGSR